MSGALFSVSVSTQTRQPNTKPRNQSQNRTETKPKAQPNPVPNPKPSPKTNPNVPSKWYCNCSSFLLCRTFLRNATASIRGLAVHIMMIKMNAKSEIKSFQVCTNTHWLSARTNVQLSSIVIKGICHICRLGVCNPCPETERINAFPCLFRLPLRLTNHIPDPTQCIQVTTKDHKNLLPCSSSFNEHRGRAASIKCYPAHLEMHRPTRACPGAMANNPDIRFATLETALVHQAWFVRMCFNSIHAESWHP